MTALHAQVRVRDRVEATLEVEAGTTTAVMGPSGAGKSTLVEAVAGLVRIDAGRVSIGGRDVSDPRPRVPVHRRGAVLLGQDPRLFPHLSARDNIAFGLRARRVPRAEAAGRADELLWRVGLPGSGDHRPGELSGGQQQRVALARALAARPDVLLLDEPLTALDPETAAGIRGVLADVLSGITTVLVTHDPLDAVALADRLVVLEGGTPSQSGAVRDVLARPATGFVATLAGLNRLVGVVRAGRWIGGGIVLTGAADDGLGDGPAAAVFRPGAVTVEPLPRTTWTAAVRIAGAEPDEPGSWLARIERIEPTPAGVRVHTQAPAGGRAMADLALDDVARMQLSPGAPVRLTVASAQARFQRA